MWSSHSLAVNRPWGLTYTYTYTYMYIVNAINTTCVFSALVTTIVYYTCTYKFRIVLSSAVHMILSFLNTICVVPALMTTLSIVYCTYSKRNKSTMYCSGQNYCELFMARRAIPMIAFHGVESIYIYIQPSTYASMRCIRS